jgi:hypothetical protein
LADLVTGMPRRAAIDVGTAMRCDVLCHALRDAVAQC